MGFSPFESVSGYPAMLNKIGISTFFISLGATWLLRKNLAPLGTILSPLDLTVTIQGLSVQIGYVIPALVLALSFRIFKVHDRISDLFGIRRRFDVHEILVPLAGEVGVAVSVEKAKRMAEKRDDLMREVFYRYASGTPSQAVIDEQMITMALDQWSWYWMLLEASAIILPCALVLLVLLRTGPAACLLLTFVVLLGFMRLLMPLSADYAHREVKAIVEDQARRNHLRQALGAL